MMNENYNGVEPQQKAQIAPKARTESADSLGSRSESKNSLAAKTDDEKVGDLGQVKFTKNVDEAAVEIGAVDVAFAGMGKEELMKYANDPFWIRLRWTLFALFWIAWIAMLVIAIVIVVLAPKCPAPAPLEYWQKGVVYSVNLKSFQDGAQQDGKGDLQGVMGRLKHFVHLGVNMIAISPIFKTAGDEPQYGYDIVDFRELNPAYGSPKDVKELVEAAKVEGLKIILDVPINHVSDQHLWFSESVNNRTGKCGDCFVWSDGNPTSPPNNWVSIFGGSAWKKSTDRNQYYYHVYGPNQPDLNFRSDKVKMEFKDILKFWLDRGVSGFRFLSVPYLFESADTSLNEELVEGTNNPLLYTSLRHNHTKNLDETYKFISEIRGLLQEYEDKDGDHRVLIVEAEDTEGGSAMRYYGNETNRLADVTVNSKLTKTEYEMTGLQLKSDVESYLKEVESTQGWPNWVFGNRDTERVASRMKSKRIDAIAMVHLLLPGTPITYYGDELGMEDVGVDGSNPVVCPSGNQITAQSHCNQARSPYHWDSTPVTGGFTNATKPWYSLGEVDRINAKNQTETTVSHLNVFRELVNLRKQPAIMFGTTNILEEVTTDEVFVFTRIRKGAPGYLVIVNLGSVEKTLNFGNVTSIPEDASAVVRSTDATSEMTTKGSKVDTKAVPIGPDEGLVLSFVPKS